MLTIRTSISHFVAVCLGVWGQTMFKNILVCFWRILTWVFLGCPFSFEAFFRFAVFASFIGITRRVRQCAGFDQKIELAWRVLGHTVSALGRNGFAVARVGTGAGVGMMTGWLGALERSSPSVELPDG